MIGLPVALLQHGVFLCCTHAVVPQCPHGEGCMGWRALQWWEPVISMSLKLFHLGTEN